MSSVILASGSEWRRELFSWLEVPFEVEVSQVDESVVKGDDPEETVVTLASMKAQAVVGRLNDGLVNQDAENVIVLGGDTVIVLGGEVIGKPDGLSGARETMMKLKGRSHEVFTGVCLVDIETGEKRSEWEKTEVVFRDFSDRELDEFLDSGEWEGRAGAYQITGMARAFVADIKGSMTNVIGLPLKLTADMLEDFGVRVPVKVAEVVYGKLGVLD